MVRKNDVVLKFIEFCKRIRGRIETKEKEFVDGIELHYRCILPKPAWARTVVENTDRSRYLFLELGWGINEIDRFRLEDLDTLLNLRFSNGVGSLYTQYRDRGYTSWLIDVPNCTEIELVVTLYGVHREEILKREDVDALDLVLYGESSQIE